MTGGGFNCAYFRPSSVGRDVDDESLVRDLRKMMRWKYRSAPKRTSKFAP